jgi:hypothetical protein
LTSVSSRLGFRAGAAAPPEQLAVLQRIKLVLVLRMP